MTFGIAHAGFPFLFALEIQREEIAGIVQITERVQCAVGDDHAGKSNAYTGGLVQQLGAALGPLIGEAFFGVHPTAVGSAPLWPVRGKGVEREAQEDE